MSLATAAAVNQEVPVGYPFVNKHHDAATSSSGPVSNGPSTPKHSDGTAPRKPSPRTTKRSKDATGRSDNARKSQALFRGPSRAGGAPPKYDFTTTQYLHWGYLRHTLPKSEHSKAKNSLNRWYKSLGDILNHPETLSTASWREDGTWLFELASPEMMQQAWEARSETERQEQWSKVMWSTMLLAPDKVGPVLLATLDPLPPGYAIHDLLWFIAIKFELPKNLDHRERTRRADEVLRLVETAFLRTPQGHVPVSQRAFGILARKLPSDHARDLLHIAKSTGKRLSTNTLLQFAGRLAKDLKHKQEAYDIVLELAESGVDLNTPNCASVITAILYSRSSSAEAAAFSPKAALQTLMEKGFTPNVIGFTAFLDALASRDELDEAIRLALLFAESGVRLDGRTFNAIFKAAKATHDPEKVLQALDIAKAAEAPVVDVLNNALHSVFMFSESEAFSRREEDKTTAEAPSFLPILRIYAMRFDLEPLQWLLTESLPMLLLESQPGFDEERAQRADWAYQQSIVPVITRFFDQTAVPKQQPNSTTLAIMLRAYIRSLNMPYDLMAYYEFFKSKLNDQSKGYATKIVRERGSIIHDTIILSLSERAGLSRQALHIMGDMLKDNMQKGTSAVDGGPAPATLAKPPIHPPPSRFTFSILIHALLINRERTISKQLIHVMREQGIEPNLVMWNSLVKGYAMMQDIKETVSTLQGLESAGFQPDAHTFRAFGRLQNKGKALRVMDRIINQNRETLAKAMGDELDVMYNKRRV